MENYELTSSDGFIEITHDSPSYCYNCGGLCDHWARYCLVCGELNPSYSDEEFIFNYGNIPHCVKEVECEAGHSVGKKLYRASPEMAHCDLCGQFLGSTQ